MVRTYMWNPSTQSSPAIFGNFVDEDKKSVTSLLPSTSTNLYSNRSFSNESIYRPNYLSGQVIGTSTSLSKNDAYHDATNALPDGTLTAYSNELQYPMQKSATLEPQAAWLHHPYQQPYAACYPVPFNYSVLVPSHYRWRPHIYPSQPASSPMFNQTANLRPIDPWQLRPVQIGNKVYYEPVDSSCTLYGDCMPIVPQPIASTSQAAIPNNTPLQNSSLSHSLSAAVSVPVANVSEHSSQLMQPKAADIQQSTTSSNTDFMDLPWARGNPQPKSGIRGTCTWQTPFLMTREDSVLDRATHATTASSAYRKPQYQSASSKEPHDALYEQYVSEKTISPPPQQQQWGRRTAATDPTEQYKRDLQLQIEQNRRRKEEERQRELEMERREMAKFDEYRRKVQQEMEEEERKEKEKIIAAERKAARIRALQEEAEARASREAGNRARRDSRSFNESAKAERERPSATAQSNRLEWWEKKKDHVYEDNVARKSVQSPVIPALRNKNGASIAPQKYAAFEISTNNTDISSSVPSERSNRSRSSSRMSRHSYQSSVASGRNRSSDSTRQQRKSSLIHQQQEPLPEDRRRNSEYVPKSELEREADDSRASMNPRNLGRVQHSSQMAR